MNQGLPAILETEDEGRQFRAFLLGRLGICLAIFAAVALASFVGGTTERVWLVLLPVFAVAVLTGPYLWWGARRPGSIASAYPVVLGLDVALTTVGAYFLGGENAVYGLPIYGIYVTMAAAVLSWRGVLWTAGAGIGAFAAMALATGAGWLAEQPSAFAFEFSGAWPWMTSIVNTFGVLAIALVAGSLGHVTRQSLRRSRELERRLREINLTLERRVENAVAEVRASNRSLAEKNEQLTRTFRQVELFARAVSHDLRNPLAAASESLRMALSRDAGQRERLLDLVGHNLGRADRMLMGLRDWMRSLGAKTPPEPVDVKEILQELVGEFRLARQGAPVPVLLVGPFSRVRAHREQLAHVFRNLIANALAHNEELEGLCVEVGEERADGDVCFFVRDNGRGIPPQLRSRIFLPFHRGSGGDAEGLGLGLALVDAIVSQAGGQVWVESAESGGAVFRFTLPRTNPGSG